MLARPAQNKIHRKGARRAQLWANAGIIRSYGFIRQAGPVAADLGVESFGARRVDTIIKRARKKRVVEVVLWLNPFDIRPEPAPLGEVDCCVHP